VRGVDDLGKRTRIGDTASGGFMVRDLDWMLIASWATYSRLSDAIIHVLHFG
jgi:hypothetical protein